MTHSTHSKRAARGFSLLEVLIAVVLLATGLLALAALQGSLARNSSDAKVRSRIVSLLSADLDLVRASSYATLANDSFDAATVDCTTTADAFDLAACNASTDSAIGNLTVTRTVTQYGANAGGTGFVAGAPAVGQKAEFKSVLVTASWTDATGQARTLSMNSALSSLALDVNNPLVDNNSGNTPPKAPVVRQADPTMVGMIPIAMGNGDSTAASNPTPELVGKNQGQATVGTRFTVLTYTPQQQLAEIQARVDTEVVKCVCQYGAGGNNLPSIYRASQWPAIWTGTRYDLYIPDSNTTAPGQQYASGPKAGITQSALCQECCRDHHDRPTDALNAKFDPESTATTYQKYDLNGSLQLVGAGNTTSSTYVDSCRMIRVDGHWRTAADMYSRQFAVLETTAVTDASTNVTRDARNGAPSTTAAANYVRFVKDYLKQYDGSVATAPTNAQVLFNDPTYALDPPPTLDIAQPNVSGDDRYVNSRGLYVDYLEKQARETLAKSLASRRAKGQCLAAATNLADCVLPFLPFSNVPLTEISDWAASDATVIEVNTNHKLGQDANTPSGGTITKAKKNGSSNNTATVRLSNSGVAVLANTGFNFPGGVDPNGDESTTSDAQPVVVGGNPPPSGTGFTFNVLTVDSNGSYPDATVTQTPTVKYYISAGDNGNCAKLTGDTKYSCSPTAPSGTSATVIVGAYGRSGNDTITQSFTCDSGGNNTKTDTFTVQRPYFENWAVSFATRNGTNLDVSNVTRNTYEDESTSIPVPNAAAGDLIKVHYVFQGKIVATMQSCKINGNNITINWTQPYPWK